jgi:hypothetical protein
LAISGCGLTGASEDRVPEVKCGMLPPAARTLFPLIPGPDKGFVCLFFPCIGDQTQGPVHAR